MMRSTRRTFHQNMLLFGPVVSEKMMLSYKANVNGHRSDDNSQYGPCELKFHIIKTQQFNTSEHEKIFVP